MINRKHMTAGLGSPLEAGVGGGLSLLAMSICLSVATPGRLNGFVREI